MPGPLRAFLRLFNEGRFWASHEALEDAWRRTGSAFYHGLILYASAFVHVERENAHGIRAQLEKTLRALNGLPDRHLGIDVAAIRSHARDVLDRMNRIGEEPSGGWGTAVRAPRLELSGDRVRGDEPELEDR